MASYQQYTGRYPILQYPTVIAGNFLLEQDTRMGIQDIRRARLRELIETRFNGVQAALASRLDVQPGYISRCLYPPGKKAAKPIAEKAARSMESKLGLPYGWFDIGDDGDMATKRLIDRFSRLSQDGKDALLGAAERLLLQEQANQQAEPHKPKYKEKTTA